MQGICGWVGDVADAAASHRLLAGMLRDCGAQSGIETPGLRVDALHFGYLGAAADVAGRLYADDNYAIVVSDQLQRASGRSLSARDLVDLYRAHGKDFLRRVHGPFSLALYDRGEHTVILAVDRIGQRPLYLHRNAARLSFSSRLDALRRLPGFQARLNEQALFDYLYFHVVPSPGTVYSGCEKLLPAQMVVVGADGLCRDRFYWSMPYREDNPADFDALKADFRNLLPRVVTRAAGDEHTTAALLNGYADSFAVAGTFAQLRDEPVQTYSTEYQAEGFDKIEYARIAARHFGTKAREFSVTPQDVLESIPEIAAYCDEPFGNASVVPAYLRARHARREGIERLLASDGGGAIFGGNARYANQWAFELYGQVSDSLRSRLIEPLVFSLPGGDQVAPVRKLRSFIHQAKVPLPDRLEIDNFLNCSPLSEIFVADFLAAVDPAHPLADLRAAYRRTNAQSSVNRMMHLDLKIALADNDLRKMNHACGLAGVDVRYPLLDQEMMVFAAAVPPEMQVQRTKLRWFFKQALADLVPREIIDKKKHGIDLPVGLWMVEYQPLRELTETSLASLRERGIVKPSYLDWLGEQHQGTHASNHGIMRWVLVMLEQWLQRHGY